MEKIFYRSYYYHMEGFTMFGPEHIVWLFTCLILSALILIINKKNAEAGNERLVSAIAFITLLLHLIQCAFRIFEGSYDLYTLPLHVCAISSYLSLIHSRTKSKTAGEILFFPGLPGALCALIWPDWTMYPPFGVLSATGFLAHVFIVIYVLTAMQQKTLEPSVKRIYVPVIFLAVYAAVIIPFDRHFHANYGFLNVPSPGSVLEIIAKIFGYGKGYYAGYALLAVSVMIICYGIRYLVPVLFSCFSGHSKT